MEINSILKRVAYDINSRKPLKKKAYMYMVSKINILFCFYGINDAKLRRNIVYATFMYARQIDDIVDGEKQLDDKNYNFEDYKKHILEFLDYCEMYLASKCTLTPRNDIDMLIKYSMCLSEKLGFNFYPQMTALIENERFDLLRRTEIKKGVIIPSNAQDIQTYFYDKFSDSCINPMVTISNGKSINNDLIRVVGNMSRTVYNIEDILEDINFGLLNISSEDMNLFGISESDIIKIADYSPKIIAFCQKKGYNHKEIVQLFPQPIINYLIAERTKAQAYLEWFQKSKPNDGSISEKILEIGYETGAQKVVKKLNKNSMLV